MLTPPVVVALPSLFKSPIDSLRQKWLEPCFLYALLLLVAPYSSAQVSLPVDQPSYLARIELHTAGELEDALRRSGELFNTASDAPSVPVAFILHGPEAKVFFRQNYKQNQALVDLAAKLSALNVVDIKVCRTWMGGEGLDSGRLLPFVGTVPYGPAEERRLMKKKAYRYF